MSLSQSYAHAVPLVTPDQLRAYMSNPRWPAAAVQAAPVVLDGLQGDVEAFVGYSIEPGQDPITEMVGLSRDGAFMTSAWPIAAVTSVADAMGVAYTAYRFSAEGEFAVTGSGPWDSNGYTVTYVPGLPPRALAIARSRILRAASREMSAEHDDSRANTRDTNGRKNPDPPVGFQTGELKALSRWKRRSDSVYSRQRDYSAGVAVEYGTGGYVPGARDAGGVVSVTSSAYFEGDATVEGM